jgi:hypothetical protein
MVFWKDSMDFAKIIQNKEENAIAPDIKVLKVAKQEEPIDPGKKRGVFLRNLKK